MTISSALAQTAVSVTSSATLVIAASSSREALSIQNLGASDVYLGGTSAVTTSTGTKLIAGQQLPFGDFGGALYGITTSGTADVRVLAAS
jgi:hypothetical protein